MIFGRPDLVDHAQFGANSERVRHHAELETLLNGIMAGKSGEEWLSLLWAADVPAGPINNILSAVRDPHVAARGLIREVGNGCFVAQPLKFSAYEGLTETPAPLLGEHTRHILADYGFSEAEIANLTAKGAI